MLTLNFDEPTSRWIKNLAILRGLSIEQYVVWCINQRQLETEIKSIKSNRQINEGFDVFWKAYPKKIGLQNARKAWDRIRIQADFINIVMKALEAQKPKWTDKQFIPHPASWLNAGRWLDEEERELSWLEQRRLKNGNN